MQIVCAYCHQQQWIDGAKAEEVLAELVELKRMKDSGSCLAEYERRKLIAWRNAFRLLGIHDDPKS